MPPVASNAARDRDPSNGSVPSTSSGSSAGGDSSSGRYYAYAADFSDSFNDTAVHNFQDRSESPVDSRKIKCVFVGDGAVGKTSLIVSYTTNGYPQEYVPTAFDNYSVLVRVDNQPVRLQLCDTAGQDDFDTLRPLCYPQSDVFLLCFSVVSPTSFYNLAQHWIPEIRQHAPHTPLILIGTQADLRTNVRVLLELSRYGETPVMEDEAKEFAKEINALEYIECSALTQQNLKEVFDAAILACLQINNRKSRVFLQEVKGGRTKSLKKQLRNKLKRTNSIAEEHGNPFVGDIDFEMDMGPATDRNYPHRNAQMTAVQYNGFGGHALTHCRSAVMLKRQLSTTKINEIRPQTVPPAVVKPAGQSSQKFGKLKKGWKRFLCLFT